MDDPLKELMKIIICMAILGTILALAGYFIFGPPALHAPANALMPLDV